jgi:hypothetical protein
MESILNQLNPIHIFTPEFFEKYVNIIFLTVCEFSAEYCLVKE